LQDHTDYPKDLPIFKVFTKNFDFSTLSVIVPLQLIFILLLHEFSFLLLNFSNFEYGPYLNLSIYKTIFETAVIKLLIYYLNK